MKTTDIAHITCGHMQSIHMHMCVKFEVSNVNISEVIGIKVTSNKYCCQTMAISGIGKVIWVYIHSIQYVCKI